MPLYLKAGGADVGLELFEAFGGCSERHGTLAWRCRSFRAWACHDICDAR